MRISLLLALTCLACDDAGDADPIADQGLAFDGSVGDARIDDATVDPDAMPDAAPDMGVACAASDVTFPVDPEGPDTQIHPAVAADGAGVWVVYNRVTPGESTFDVWATRIGCDGQPTHPPFEVSADPVFSDVDPTIAVGPHGVIIAWTNDVTEADPNLITRYRIIDAVGEVGAIQTLVTQREGADFDGGQWMVQAAATDAGFVLVGARGVEARSAFQVYGQRLDPTGAPAGPTAAVELDMTQQLDPDVGVAADGTIWLAWGEGDQGRGAVVAAPWTDDPLLVTQPILPAPAGSARVSAGARSYVLGHVEQRGGTDIAIRRVGGTGSVEVGEAGAIDLAPAMATQGNRGLVAWFRRIRGNRAAVWVRRLNLSDDGIEADGEAVNIATDDPAAPYPMALTALADGRFAMVWIEGEAPVYRAMLRFVAP